MIALNLLSPAQKEALRMRVIFAMIERLMITLISGLLLAGILLLGLRIELTHVLSNLTSRQVLSTEYVSTNNEIKRLNDVIARVESVQRQIVPVPTLVTDVVSRAPQGILISNFSFETKTASLRLSGQANSRDNLLIYEDRLRASPYIKTLESPISNLFEKNNINFTFDAVLNVDALKKTLEPDAASSTKPTP